MKTLLSVVAALVLTLPALAQQPAPADSGLKVPDAAQFVGAPEGKPLSGETLATETNRVGGKVRCPVCQGMAVADSPAEMAVNMKAQIRELLSRGYTEAQILKYFELSYGQFVLLEPKFEGVNTLVWLLPLAVLLIGAAIVVVKVKRLERGAPAVAAAESGPIAPEAEDPYLSRVRDLVGGGKS
jgi:cytochrome c-type biogenesis protein CcmH